MSSQQEQREQMDKERLRLTRDAGNTRIGPAPSALTGRGRYSRARDLPNLIAVFPREIDDYTIAGTEAIIARIRKVLRAVYAQALHRDPHYSPKRHVRLWLALRGETARLAHLRNSQMLATVFDKRAAQ